jgi:hypothetical protein
MANERRGEEIRFVGGVYIGYKGWMDKSKDKTALSYHVVVKSFKKKDGSTIDLATTVRKTSVRRPALETPPASYAEAIMQQHPKVEQLLDKKDGSTIDLATTVRKTSVRRPALETPPASYAEAIMQQHPKVEQLLDKLCKQLAKCEMSISDASILTVIAAKLEAAMAAQIALGSDAEWKRVRYTAPA